MGGDAAGPAAPGSMVVYSHSWLPGQTDGVAVRMMAHVQALVDRGCKVTLVTPDFVCPECPIGLKEAPKLEVPAGVEHVFLATQPTPIYRKNMCMALTLSNFFKLVSLIRRVKPDLVHGTQEASLQMLALACLICDVPFVASMHTDVVQIACRDIAAFSWLPGPLGAVQNEVAKFCTNLGYRNWAYAGTKMFAVSTQSRAFLQAAGVADTSVCSETWGPMVDSNIFRIDRDAAAVEATRKRLTHGIPNAYLMTYVGRVTPEKDVQFLVDALDRHPKHVCLAIIGAGSMIPELKKLHGAEHRIYCTGDFVGRDEVAMCLRASDCCVSASTMETVGFTAWEALSGGTPMLAVRAQGFAIHLSHGVNSRLWTPDDPQSFDDELRAMMATKMEGNWSRASLRKSVDHASIPLCTDRALTAYAEAGPVDHKLVRFMYAVFMFMANWVLAIFIK